MAAEIEAKDEATAAVEPKQNETGSKPKPPAFKPTLRFWGIFIPLCMLSFISALDVMIIATALPRIVAEIGGATLYPWIASSFVIASSVPILLFGQLANIFGRRWPFVTAVVFFIVGSGVAGGATSPGMLIAGRTIQGVGGAGIYVMLDIVCCDLVPLRERGKYLGLMFAWAGLAAALGPVVGGSIADKNWRWIFYLNIPICGLALGALILFMGKMKTGRTVEVTGVSSLRQIDYTGNLIFAASLISLLLGLVRGGIDSPWGSAQIIVPIVLGVLGWAGFHVHQHFTKYPCMPTHIFSNRTSAVGFALIFLSSVLVQMAGYFLPVYFQALFGVTVLDAGVYFLPFAIATLVSAIIAGALLTAFGHYRPIHAAAAALAAISFGLFTRLGSGTAKVEWAWYELIGAFGAGPMIATTLPAIMAALVEADVASASAAYSFFKGFGYVWGVAIPSIVFNGICNSNLDIIPDEGLRDQLRDGGAYSFAAKVGGVRDSYAPDVWATVEEVYLRSFRGIWWIGLGLSLLMFVLVFVEKALPLRTELETEYGLDDRRDTPSQAAEESGSGGEVTEGVKVDGNQHDSPRET